MRTHSALLIFVLLLLVSPLAIPGEDLTETAYDESENLPYENTSLVFPQAAAPAIRATTSTLPFRPHSWCRVSASLINSTDAHPAAESRLPLRC